MPKACGSPHSESYQQMAHDRCGSRDPLKGRQPIEQTPTRLLRLSKDLPHDWIELRHFLGFADGRSIISGQNAL